MAAETRSWFEAGWSTTDDGKKSPQKWIDDLYQNLKEEFSKTEIENHLKHIEKLLLDEMGREYTVWDKVKKDYIPKTEFKHEEMKLKSIEKVRSKI